MQGCREDNRTSLAMTDSYPIFQVLWHDLPESSGPHLVWGKVLATLHGHCLVSTPTGGRCVVR